MPLSSCVPSVPASHLGVILIVNSSSCRGLGTSFTQFPVSLLITAAAPGPPGDINCNISICVAGGGIEGGGVLAPHPAHFGHSGAGHSQLSLFTASALRRTVVACRIAGTVSHHSRCIYLASLFSLLTIQTYAFSETLFGNYWPDQPSLYGGDGCILSIYLVVDIDSCWS